MTIKIPNWLVHHALKIFPLTAVAYIITGDIRKVHWALDAASWVFVVLTLAFLCLGAVHAYFAPCPQCKEPKAADRLRRLHYRAVVGISRYAGIPVFVTFTATSVIGEAIWGGEGKWGNKHFEWTEDAIRLALLLSLCAFYAAVRFDRVNHPGAVRPEPLTKLLRTRATSLIHKGHWLYAASLIPMIITGFLPSHGLWGAVNTLAVLLYLGAWYVERQHGTTLCEECVTEFPTDAPGHAEQHKWRFKVYHRNGTALIGLMAAGFGITLLPHLWNAVAYIPIAAFLAASALVARFHSSYQPWCPYCRRGRGGDDHEVVPDPTGDHGRPLPVA